MMDSTEVVKPLVQQMIFKILKNFQPRLNERFGIECNSKKMLILDFCTKWIRSFIPLFALHAGISFNYNTIPHTRCNKQHQGNDFGQRISKNFETFICVHQQTNKWDEGTNKWDEGSVYYLLSTSLESGTVPSDVHTKNLWSLGNFCPGRPETTVLLISGWDDISVGWQMHATTHLWWEGHLANFLPGLALNRDPPDLSLQSS
jgi:hypothetical protein